MKQLYSDLKKILFGAVVVLAIMGWINASQATRGIDRAMTERVVASGTVVAPEHDDSAQHRDRIAELIAENSPAYHSTVRVLPHIVYGVTIQEAEDADESRRENKHCDIEQVGCTLDKLWAQVF